MTHRFSYRNGQLYCEELPLTKLAEKYGTPCYVYSRNTIVDNFSALSANLGALREPMICYAVKANGLLAILSTLAELGAGFDVTSAGELLRVLRAGGRASRCTFVGVGKRREEIELGLRKGVYTFNVESEDELLLINEVAGTLKKRAPFSIRVNPDVDARTHRKITTGRAENKFGINYEKVAALYRKAARLPHLRARGVQMHIGSQITSLEPFERAVRRMIPLVEELRDAHGIEFFDIGGGVGIPYKDALASGSPAWWKKHPQQITLQKYAATLAPLLAPLGVKILLEPGRALVGQAGVLLTRVLYIKQAGRKIYTIVDGGMNDLIRPTLYEAHHEIVPLQKRNRAALETDVVGPVCESGDYFAQGRLLPAVRPGEFLAVMSAGAYGSSMASNYNARPRPAEVLVDGTKALLARRRENFADLLRGEVCG